MVEGEPIIQIHGIVIDQTRWEVSVDGKPITLSKSEFLLLRFLAIHPGWIIPDSRSSTAREGQTIP